MIDFSDQKQNIESRYQNKLSTFTFMENLLEYSHLKNKKCQKHSSELCNILLLAGQIEKFLLCSQCVEEQNISSKSIANIQKIESYQNPLSIKKSFFNNRINKTKSATEIEQLFLKLQKDTNEFIEQIILENKNQIQRYFQFNHQSDSMNLSSQIPETNDISEKEEYLEQLQNDFKSKLISQIESFQFSLNQECKLTTQSFLPSSNFHNSVKDLLIEVQNDTILIKKIGNDYLNKQSYIVKPLIPDLKYVIRLSLYNVTNHFPFFTFGLICEDEKDSQDLWYKSMCYGEVSSEMTTEIKGGKIYTGKKKKIGKKSYEFQICISQQLFKICSYPNYDKQAEITEKSKINQNVAKNFAIQIANEGDYVIIEKFMIVADFENH